MRYEATSSPKCSYVCFAHVKSISECERRTASELRRPLGSIAKQAPVESHAPAHQEVHLAAAGFKRLCASLWWDTPIRQPSGCSGGHLGPRETAAAATMIRGGNRVRKGSSIS